MCGILVLVWISSFAGELAEMLGPKWLTLRRMAIEWAGPNAGGVPRMRKKFLSAVCSET